MLYQQTKESKKERKEKGFKYESIVLGHGEL